MLKIYYTKTNEQALDLKLDYKNNAGIDLYPDLSNSLNNALDFYDRVNDYYHIKFDDEGNLTVIVQQEPSIVLVDTYYMFAFPSHVHGIVHGRSGNFFKSGINVFNGVIDSSYRGPVKVGLIFNKKGIYKLTTDKAIAQLVIIGNIGGEICLEYVDKERFYNEFFNTERKDKGFGSSGYIS